MKALIFVALAALWAMLVTQTQLPIPTPATWQACVWDAFVFAPSIACLALLVTDLFGARGL